MTDTKYYPVIDCNSEGTQKAALFPIYNRDIVSKNHSLWLEEIIPHHFRLCTKNTKEPRVTGIFTIHCPACGKPLKCIAQATSNNRLGLYECSSCNNN
ncbi:MAG: hypothetical protein EOM40_16120 [Clostridia bacterium]|nr:hypothetical protein [Clostridia bacterium]